MDSKQLSKHSIVKCAVIRFRQFGILKTTMEEIASDLSISRSSLNYYFKYKELLVMEVLNKLSSEYLGELNKITLNEDRNFYDVIDAMIELKGKYFKKNFSILTYSLTNIGLIPKKLTRVWAFEKRAYNELFCNRLVFNTRNFLDNRKKTNLYLYYIQTLYTQKLLMGNYIITEKEVKRLSHNVRTLSHIIIKGLL